MNAQTSQMSTNVPQEAEELMALADRDSIEEAFHFLDPEQLADARAGGGLAWGVSGHGVMSRTFRLVARTKGLDLDMTRPALRSLSDEETQAKIAEDIRSVCRLAALAYCKVKGGQIDRIAVRSESAGSWAWCLERGDWFRVGDTFDELVDWLAADCDNVDPLMVAMAMV